MSDWCSTISEAPPYPLALLFKTCTCRIFLPRATCLVTLPAAIYMIVFPVAEPRAQPSVQVVALWRQALVPLRTDRRWQRIITLVSTTSVGTYVGREVVSATLDKSAAKEQREYLPAVWCAHYDTRLYT